MNYKVVATDLFKRKFKVLQKKYYSLTNDFELLKKELLANPEMGVDMGDNTRKVRMAIKSKNRGKSGGARIITCNVLVDVLNIKIYLLSIYDKSEQESLSKKEIEKLKRESGLL